MRNLDIRWTAAILLVHGASSAPGAPVEDCKSCLRTCCPEHIQADREGMEASAKGLLSFEEDERLQALEAVAHLNLAHENRPSSEVTEKLCSGLGDPSLAVRLKTIELLERGQDPTMALEQLILALEENRDALDAWKDVPALSHDPTDAELDALRVTQRPVVEELEGSLRAQYLVLVLYTNILRGLGPPPATSSSQKRKRNKEYEKALEQAEQADELFYELRRSLSKVTLASEAMVLGAALSSELSRYADDRSVKAVRRFYEKACARSPSHCAPIAQSLLELECRDAWKAVVDSLEKLDHAARRPVHDALAAGALRVELSGAPDWGPAAASDWAAWYVANKKILPRKLGRTRKRL